MLPGDYIAFKLTNEIVTTKNGLSEGMLWDYHDKKLAEWLLEHYKIDIKLTPPLVENFEDQGRVTPKAAQETGLPNGIPIRYRAGDQPNNALSLNVLRPGRGCLQQLEHLVYFLLLEIDMPPMSFLE